MKQTLSRLCALICVGRTPIFAGKMFTRRRGDAEPRRFSSSARSVGEEDREAVEGAFNRQDAKTPRNKSRAEGAQEISWRLCALAFPFFVSASSASPRASTCAALCLALAGCASSLPRDAPQPRIPCAAIPPHTKLEQNVVAGELPDDGPESRRWLEEYVTLRLSACTAQKAHAR